MPDKRRRTVRSAQPEKKSKKRTIVLSAALAGLFLVLWLIFALVRNAANASREYSYEVYAAGWREYGSRSVACYWVNDQPVHLPGANGSSEVLDMVVVDGKVYAAGWYEDRGIIYACYWVDNELTQLPGGTVARSITVANGKVYVAGYLIANASMSACVWEDGKKTELLFGTDAFDITVVRNTVYVAGANDREARYWVNGNSRVLPGANYASSIAVSDGVVYISGGTGFYNSPSQVCYWIDGVRHELSGLVYAKSIAVSGESVYISGRRLREGDVSEACYWVDGTVYDLPGGRRGLSFDSNALTLVDGNVYIAGHRFVPPAVTADSPDSSGETEESGESGAGEAGAVISGPSELEELAELAGSPEPELPDESRPLDQSGPCYWLNGSLYRLPSDRDARVNVIAVWKKEKEKEAPPDTEG